MLTSAGGFPGLSSDLPHVRMSNASDVWLLGTRDRQASQLTHWNVRRARN